MGEGEVGLVNVNTIVTIDQTSVKIRVLKILLRRVTTWVSNLVELSHRLSQVFHSGSTSVSKARRSQRTVLFRMMTRATLNHILILLLTNLDFLRIYFILIFLP